MIILATATVNGNYYRLIDEGTTGLIRVEVERVVNGEPEWETMATVTVTSDRALAERTWAAVLTADRWGRM